jgi:uncharacterized protein
MSTKSSAGRIEDLESVACLELLASQSVGRVAFVIDGRPVILPVNYAVDGWSIVFRTSYGSKLVAASTASQVAFESDSFDRSIRSGWSVVAQGTAESVYDEEMIDRLEALELDTWADGQRDHWVRIHPDEITGRRVVQRPE